MKLTLIAIALFFAGASAHANTLTCTIQSGEEKSSASLGLEGADGRMEPAMAEGVYDLSFNMTVSCERGTCEGVATIDSQIVEDEVRQLAFDFRKSQRGRVYSKAFTNSADKRDYVFYCYNNK